MSSELARLVTYLSLLEADGFWGTLTIAFKAGKVIKMTTAQDFVLETLPKGPGAREQRRMTAQMT